MEINSKEGKLTLWIVHIGDEQRWLLKFDQCELLAVVDVVRGLRINFLKLALLHDFETSLRVVKKL